MPGAFSSDDAEVSSGTKPDFIARIERSQPNDPDGENEGISEEYKEEGKNYYEFLYELAPIAKRDGEGDWEDAEWDNLYEYGVEMSQNFHSKWMFLIGHLENIHGSLSELGIEGAEDLQEFLEGRTYVFREFDFTENDDFTWEESPDEYTVTVREMFGDSENSPNSMMVPVKEVTDEQLEELGIGDGDEDVEEVEL